MAGSVNKVILLGNIGKDPEIKATQNGSKLASFSMVFRHLFRIDFWHRFLVELGLILTSLGRHLAPSGPKVAPQTGLKDQNV